MTGRSAGVHVGFEFKGKSNEVLTMRRGTCVIFVLSLIGVFAAPTRADSFQGLGMLPGATHSYARDMSADGLVVVGVSDDSPTNSVWRAFRWTPAGMADLGAPPGDTRSSAYGVSADGDVVVGYSQTPGPWHGFRWTQTTGMQVTPTPPGAQNWEPLGASADGSVLVGHWWAGFDNVWAYVPFRWTQAGGYQILGELPGGSANSNAYRISSDGSVIVGWGSSVSGTEAFRWTPATGIVGLGDLPGGTFESQAIGVSPEGNIIVGQGKSAGGTEAFRWTAADGMIGLGDLPGGTFGSSAYCVSRDGLLIGGYGNSAAGQEAVLWDSSGIQRVADVLTAHGVVIPTGWTLTSCTAVVINGAVVTLCGNGTNPSGGVEAWVASYTCLESTSDCNGNGLDDACELSFMTDCDGSGTLDECEGLPDCDGNGVPDACDPDCNANGLPDGCDLAAGTSADCNGDGVPDECQRGDIDGDGISDVCDPLQLHKRLLLPDVQSNDRYGASVAVSGDWAFVGAPIDKPFNATNASARGSVSVFHRDRGGSGEWGFVQKLQPADLADYAYLGQSVAADGDTLVAGGYYFPDYQNPAQGLAYVFVRSGDRWEQQARLTASDGAVGDNFGNVAIDGDTLVVGAYGDDGPAGADQGSAYVFVRDAGAWTQVAKLLAPDAAVGDTFGSNVAISGDTIVVGAPYDNGPAGNDQGSAYVFVGSGANWTQQAKLTSPDPGGNQLFGAYVAIDGDTLAVSEHQDSGALSQAGAVHVFARNGATWTPQAKLTASDANHADYFGSATSKALALQGDWLAVGARGVDETAWDQGAVYVFTRSGTTWSQQAELFSPDAAYGDWWFSNVALDQGTLVVGAPYISYIASSCGMAYVFEAAPPPPPAPPIAMLFEVETVYTAPYDPGTPRPYLPGLAFDALNRPLVSWRWESNTSSGNPYDCQDPNFTWFPMWSRRIDGQWTIWPIGCGAGHARKETLDVDALGAPWMARADWCGDHIYEYHINLTATPNGPGYCLYDMCYYQSACDTVAHFDIEGSSFFRWLDGNASTAFIKDGAQIATAQQSWTADVDYEFGPYPGGGAPAHVYILSNEGGNVVFYDVAEPGIFTWNWFLTVNGISSGPFHGQVDLEVDATGRRHVFVAEWPYAPVRGRRYYCSSDDGVNWDMALLDPSAGLTRDGSAALDGNGTLYYAYYVNTGGSNREVRLARMNMATGQWSIKVVDTVGRYEINRATDIHLAIDHNNRPAILYIDDNGTDPDVKFAYAPNHAPAVDCPAAAVLECAGPAGTQAVHTVHVTDVDGDPLTVTWSVDSQVVQVDQVPGGGASMTSAYSTLTYTYSPGVHDLQLLVDDGNFNGQTICPTGVTVEDTTPPVVTAPDDIAVSADAGYCTALLDTGTPTATDLCVPDYPFVFAGTRSDSLPLTDPYPSGTTTITWSTVDAYGNPGSDTQTVNVLAFNDFQASVTMQGLSTAVTRCIRFTFKGSGAPVVVDKDLAFDGLGQALDVVFAGTDGVPCGLYDCVTAEDGLHTLRTRVTPGISSGQYVANFTGAAELVTADFHDDNLIDIVDFGVYIAQWGTCYDSNGDLICDGDTPCSYAPPVGIHADANGDGVLDASDYAAISNNFLMVGAAECGAAPPFAQPPRESISVAAMQARGVAGAWRADLNGDGFIDLADVQLFLSGVLPKGPTEGTADELGTHERNPVPAEADEEHAEASAP